jgi:hypothetical protein
VTATGGNYFEVYISDFLGGAGIGGGLRGDGGTVIISGGSVKAVGGGGDAEDIGHGCTYPYSSSPLISGTLTDGSSVYVYLNTLTFFSPSPANTSNITSVSIGGYVPSSYGLKDVVVANEGKVYFYFTANDTEEDVVVTVDGENYVGYYIESPDKTLVILPECTHRTPIERCGHVCMNAC